MKKRILKNESASGLTERQGAILAAIVKEYILSAEPVGSKAVAFSHSASLGGVSPATIRNIMAELEGAGYLAQPHTSAGRVPTEKGFRFYVDSLLEVEEPTEEAKGFFRKCLDGPSNIEDVLTNTTRVLSSLTGCAGLLFIPEREGFVIRNIRLLPVERNGLVVVFVSTLGLARTRFVRTDIDISGLDLERIANYLNSIGGGLTVGQLRARLREDMAEERNLYDELLSKAYSLCGALFNQDMAGPGGEDALYLDGKVNVLEQPEFRDNFVKMRGIFAAFEEKRLLIKILDQCAGAHGISIYLGSETSVKEFEGLGFVIAPCAAIRPGRGSLGVVGPVRMNYSKVVPLVGYASVLLSEMF